MASMKKEDDEAFKNETKVGKIFLEFKLRNHFQGQIFFRSF
jgi:hypothetical protein